MEQILTQHPSLSDRIFEIMEEAILSGSIRPGERIIETELAKKLGISKSPVREALKKLEGEGIVQLVPRKGFFVRNIDRKSIDDLCDVMFIIELAAARLSLKKKTEAVCKKIDEILDQMKRHLRTRDYASYVLANRQFHGLFYDLTENEWILKISQMFFKEADMLRSLSLYTSDRFSRSIEEHDAIADAYKKGDEERLERAVKKHLIMFRDNILKSGFVREDPLVAG
jgi:DNA-binding GntR family transcriptional regulator